MNQWWLLVMSHHEGQLLVFLCKNLPKERFSRPVSSPVSFLFFFLTVLFSIPKLQKTATAPAAIGSTYVRESATLYAALTDSSSAGGILAMLAERFVAPAAITLDASICGTRSNCRNRTLERTFCPMLTARAPPRD